MGKLYARVCAAETWLAAALLVAMVVLIFLGGVMRMAGAPINWSGDAATCFFAWACFLCADIARRRNALMSIELATERLPARWRRACAVSNHVVICAFLGYVIVYGAWLSWISRARSFQGIPEISYSWVTLSMPVGATLLLITAVLKIRTEIAGAASSPPGAPQNPRTTT
jgi:TRAP-type transport system small permease protein